jgi:glycosyltransferase involved in cell wall biosynthesis
MNISNHRPFFSIIIPSRNRPELLRKAVDSVLGQSFSDFELILVNDGSDEEHAEKIEAISELAPEKIKIINLRQYPRGHGQSYAINSGAWLASGRYLTFLDDDDFWTTSNHLEMAHNAITRSNTEVDIYFANQIAHDEATGNDSPLWLYPLVDRLKERGKLIDQDCYNVTKEELMSCPGFAHLNVSIVRRDVYAQINGMDEDIRYECDLDFYFRVVDAAENILFSKNIVAQHRVPDKSKSDNMSTAINTFQKTNYRLYLLNKIITSSNNAHIIYNAKRRMTYSLKNSTAAAAEQDNFRLAFYYARQAFATKPSFKWGAYCLYLASRSLGQQKVNSNR